jgi:hypothetical protein
MMCMIHSRIIPGLGSVRLCKKGGPRADHCHDPGMSVEFQTIPLLICRYGDVIHRILPWFQHDDILFGDQARGFFKGPSIQKNFQFVF